jgi:hypothetical protein
MMLNFFGGDALFELPGHLQHHSRQLMIAKYGDINEFKSIERVLLRPYEARVYQLSR